jgi:hypothetical protein
LRCQRNELCYYENTLICPPNLRVKMSRSFAINMQNLTDKNKCPELVSKRTQRQGEQFGSIVAYVTGSPTQTKNPVLCWNKIKRKSCCGKIDASIEVGNFNILWHCLECGQHGSIYNWEQTPWDGAHR